MNRRSAASPPACSYNVVTITPLQKSVCPASRLRRPGCPADHRGMQRTSGDGEPGGRVRFSAAEADSPRHVRFGSLPPRVLPAELVETVDAAGQQRLDEPLDEWTWRRLNAAG